MKMKAKNTIGVTTYGKYVCGDDFRRRLQFNTSCRLALPLLRVTVQGEQILCYYYKRLSIMIR